MTGARVTDRVSYLDSFRSLVSDYNVHIWSIFYFLGHLFYLASFELVTVICSLETNRHALTRHSNSTGGFR